MPTKKALHPMLRFWDFVKITDGCWEWQKLDKSNGYGYICYNNRTFSAHRLSWEIHYGEIPEGMCILHKCDNRGCARPDHLFLGTEGDNNKDRHKKGRDARGDKHGKYTHPESILRGEKHWSKTNPILIVKGEKHGMSKLVEDDVRFIRQAVIEGATHMSLAKKFGVSRPTIGGIVNGHYWKHLL